MPLLRDDVFAVVPPEFKTHKVFFAILTRYNGYPLSDNGSEVSADFSAISSFQHTLLSL